MAENDELGLRMTVRFERNPMPAGEVSGVDTEIKNVGKQDVVWLHDGCAQAVGVSGTMSDVKWPLGIDQSGLAGEFKDMALYQWDGSIRLMFDFDFHLGRGGYGCADIGLIERILPGKSIKQELYWDGLGGRLSIPPPPGPADIRLWAGYYSRPGEESNDAWIVEKPGAAWVTAGPDSAPLSPAEAIDAALAVPEFIEWLGRLNLGNGNEPFVVFNAATRRWEVGTVIWSQPALLKLVLIDGATGEVLDFVDRQWLPDVDPFP